MPQARPGQEPDATAVGYHGAEGGILGAVSRVKARHQLRYAENPNPHRTAQQIANGEIQVDKGPGKLGLTFEEVQALLTLQNKGTHVPDEEVQAIMNQCKVDGKGRLLRTEVGHALSLFVNKDKKSMQPKCCVVS